MGEKGFLYMREVCVIDKGNKIYERGHSLTKNNGRLDKTQKMIITSHRRSRQLKRLTITFPHHPQSHPHKMYKFSFLNAKT